MKTLTVQQPWAWAIIHGGKDVENRTQLWSYRGPLAIHAGMRWSSRGRQSPLIRSQIDFGSEAMVDRFGEQWPRLTEVGGYILGVVTLDDVHTAQDGCCQSPWAEREYVEHGGRTRREITHLVLSDPRPVPLVEATGRLGLWEFGGDL